MNSKELGAIFSSKKISRSIYSLDGEVPDDKICLDKSNGIWEVYYSERGIKRIIMKFYNENEACEFMYNKVMDMISAKIK